MSEYETNEKLKDYYSESMKLVREDLANKDQYDALKDEFRQAVKLWEKDRVGARPKPPKQAFGSEAQHPAGLFNAMINPIIPYAIKGVIWYQGEANALHQADKHKEFLQGLINSWRRLWGQGKMYFFWCQLANFRDVKEMPVNRNSWVEVSEQLRLALEGTEDTGLVVLHDVGEVKDIHPKNKIDVGKRFSLHALNKAYGIDLVASGPLYEKHEINQDKFIISFTEVGDGLMSATKVLLNDPVETDGSLTGFQICDQNNQWKWAEAKIIGSNQIEVFHPEVKDPKEVRYAWASNPKDANLYNKAGLPAASFRTE